jgi:hypothetical protein
MRKFNLSIRMGNAAVQSPRDIARLLRKAADHIQTVDFCDLVPWQALVDDNGNVVGRYEIVDTSLGVK